MGSKIKTQEQRKKPAMELIVLSSSDEEDDSDSDACVPILPNLRPFTRSLGTSSSTDSSPVSHSSGSATDFSDIQTRMTVNPMLVDNDAQIDIESYLIKTLEKMQCSFCYTNLNPGDGVMLRSCLHNFCMDCIQALIQQSDSSQITCPGPGCQAIVHDREVQALINPEAYQAYLNRSLKTAQKEQDDLTCCQNPLCAGVFSLPANAVAFTCLICEFVTCVKCKSLRNGDVCKCRTAKRSSTGESEQPEKMTKIDQKLKNDWEANWSQISKSVSKSPMTSSSKSIKGCGDCSMQDVLKKMEQDDLLKSTKEFNCNICLMDIPPGDGVILKECFHMFCGDCLSGSIVHCEEINVKCPFQMNDYSCQSYISDREIKAILGPESHEKFLRRSITQAELSMGNSFHCKTVNCTAWCEFEEGAEIFKCPICEKNNCLKCRAIHEAVSCLEYKAKLDEDEMDEKTKKMFGTLIKKGQAMKCPTCKVMIQKIQGCDGMMCSICKTHICWATKGPRWGPKGVGDKSGGCHCREKPGKLCHPKCGNCH